MFQVLIALADGEKHGYAIIKEVARRTGGGSASAPARSTPHQALRAGGLIAESTSGRTRRSTMSGGATTG